MASNVEDSVLVSGRRLPMCDALLHTKLEAAACCLVETLQSPRCTAVSGSAPQKFQLLEVRSSALVNMPA